MARPKHPNKEIEAALQYAESKDWTVEKTRGSSHAWGRARCSGGRRGDCLMSVWSTPRVPENHARQIRRRVDACTHRQEPNP